MKKIILQTMILVTVLFIVFCGSNNEKTNHSKSTTTIENKSVESTFIKTMETEKTSTTLKQSMDNFKAITDEIDTITTIKFNELSISINRLIIYDEENKIKQIQKDTVEIYIELGETVEGQLISISSDQLTNLIIDQRYETSVTIMNEGPHCDLTDWLHFYSNWRKLQANSKGYFICDKYSEKEYEKFPKISINDLKQKVKDQCGEEWLELVEKIKTPTEYPSGVSISRYYLRVTGQRKDNGQTVTKLIIIETPMGC